VPERRDEEAACRAQELQEELDRVRQRLAEALADNQALTEAAEGAARMAAAQEPAAADAAAGPEAPPPPQRERLVSPRRWGSARGRQLAQQLEEAERALKSQVNLHTDYDSAGTTHALSMRS
jgi:hypothetical protein